MLIYLIVENLHCGYFWGAIQCVLVFQSKPLRSGHVILVGVLLARNLFMAESSANHVKTYLVLVKVNRIRMLNRDAKELSC